MYTYKLSIMIRPTKYMDSMKKLGNKGFGVVGILVILVAIGIIGGVGYYVYNNRNGGSTESNSPASTESSTPAGNTKIDTTIHEVDITMQTEADISKLPDYTPASFKAYMLDVLSKNKFSHNDIDDVDTIAQYNISKISQVNIAGGQAPVDKNGEGHAGGAPIIWVLTPKGTWDEETLNGPVCKSKNGGLIYEEFAMECSTDPNTESWTKNPNGSITTLNN